MGKRSPHTSLFIVIGCSFLSATALHAAATATASAKSQFTFTDAAGKKQSAPIVSKYYRKKIQHPLGKVDRGVNPKLLRAATIAQERARAHSRERCWRYVKEALLAAGVVNSYPKTVYAKEAAHELVSSFGFKKLSVRDPFQAPVGSVLVYGSKKAAGHVEIRTRDGFVSDFKSKIPSPRPLIGVYAKS
jgi:hypothetical protein